MFLIEYRQTEGRISKDQWKLKIHYDGGENTNALAQVSVELLSPWKIHPPLNSETRKSDFTYFYSDRHAQLYFIKVCLGQFKVVLIGPIKFFNDLFVRNGLISEEMCLDLQIVLDLFEYDNRVEAENFRGRAFTVKFESNDFPGILMQSRFPLSFHRDGSKGFVLRRVGSNPAGYSGRSLSNNFRDTENSEKWSFYGHKIAFSHPEILSQFEQERMALPRKEISILGLKLDTCTDEFMFDLAEKFERFNPDCASLSRKRHPYSRDILGLKNSFLYKNIHQQHQESNMQKHVSEKKPQDYNVYKVRRTTSISSPALSRTASKAYTLYAPYAHSYADIQRKKARDGSYMQLPIENVYDLFDDSLLGIRHVECGWTAVLCTWGSS
ncbi:unnamed protein product [Lepeophtheirus salmonis]|uniref:(salmon louse) hypothetical protein n=1 Tax=Lepeophtheirus salmonis TaxID=72036 RepID=A0A7R8CW63_LEPSM|nr:unnamed protein product [Lepeophtheirus salmonis]CAF2949633.1 unnamed protein product [Lepeophtheirus salmonis]